MQQSRGVRNQLIALTTPLLLRNLCPPLVPPVSSGYPVGLPCISEKLLVVGRSAPRRHDCSPRPYLPCATTIVKAGSLGPRTPRGCGYHGRLGVLTLSHPTAQNEFSSPGFLLPPRRQRQRRLHSSTGSFFIDLIAIAPYRL
jgi:hypothetical protein